MFPAPPNGVVYFVEAGNAIKIGFTHAGGCSDPSWRQIEDSFHSRLAVLQSNGPDRIKVLATTFTGGRTLENRLHFRFWSGRIHGEWFAKDTPGLAEEIAKYLDRRCRHCETAQIEAHIFICDDCLYQAELKRVARNAEIRLERKTYIGRVASVTRSQFRDKFSPLRQ